MSTIATLAAAPRAVAFSSPLLIGTGALPKNLRDKAAVSTQLPSTKPARSLRGVNVPQFLNGVFSSSVQVIDGALKAYDQIKEGYEGIRSGLFARKLRLQWEKTAKAEDVARYVYDAEGWDRLPPDVKLVRKEGDGATGNVEADLAYEYGGFVCDFFKRRLDVIFPQPLLQVVNFKEDRLQTGLFNAMNADYLFDSNFVLYGQGDGKHYRSMVHAIDVVGHEFMHRYLDTVHPGKFPYAGQAGALNEHICDVIGACVKAERLGIQGKAYPKGFWRMGAEVMMNPEFSINDMMNPGEAYHDLELGDDPQVGHMKDFVVTEEDSGGVHINAGIMNRLFALFCKSVDSPAYEVPLTIWKIAIESVGENPSFRDFGKALMYAAVIYDGENGTDLQASMLKACKKVGLLDYAVVDGEVLRLKPINMPKADRVEEPDAGE